MYGTVVRVILKVAIVQSVHALNYYASFIIAHNQSSLLLQVAEEPRCECGKKFLLLLTNDSLFRVITRAVHSRKI